MKVLIITQHYPPDLGVSAFRLKALTDELLKREHEVTVLTATPNRYSSLKITQGLPMKEDVIRIPVQNGKNSALAQIRRQISFYLKMKKNAKMLCKENEFDIAIISSPPFLIGIAGISLKKRVKKLVLEIRDLWPDTIVDLGKARESNPVIKIMRRYERKMYKTADRIVTVLPFMNDRISSKGIPGEKLVSFTNGLDGYIKEGIEAWCDKKAEARKKLSIPKDKFVVSYVGNVGLGQDLGILTEAARQLPEIEFMVTGDGSDKARLLNLSEGLKNVHFMPPVQRIDVPVHYAASDVLFIHLANVKLYTDALPSKTFEYAVSNRPVIYGLDGSAAEILDNSHSGIRIKRGSSSELIGAIKEIQENYDDYAKKACEGKKYVVNNYMRDKIVENYCAFLENAV